MSRQAGGLLDSSLDRCGQFMKELLTMATNLAMCAKMRYSKYAKPLAGESGAAKAQHLYP